MPSAKIAVHWTKYGHSFFFLYPENGPNKKNYYCFILAAFDYIKGIH